MRKQRNDIKDRLHRNPRISRFAIITIASAILLTLLALFGPYITPHNIYASIGKPLEAPSAQAWFGTDELGRDIFSRVLFGARSTMFIAFSCSIIGLVIGTMWGLLSGMARRGVDIVSMRLIDSFLSFPSVVIALAIIAVFGAGVFSLIIALSIVQIPRFARLVRSETLSVKERDFVKVTAAFGARLSFTLRSAVLPNLVRLLVVQTSLVFASVILMEAGLSYLGFGVRPPEPSWGSMLNSAQSFMRQAPFYSIFPGVMIFICVLIFSQLGDIFDDLLDPRSRKH